MTESVKHTIAAGSPQIIALRRLPAGISAIPGSGGTMLVEHSRSPKNQAETAQWFPWPHGTVSAPADAELVGRVTMIRATAIGADGVLEVAE